MKIGQLVFVWTTGAYLDLSARVFHASGYFQITGFFDDKLMVEPADEWIRIRDTVLWPDEIEDPPVLYVPVSDVWTIDDVGLALNPDCARPER